MLWAIRLIGRSWLPPGVPGEPAQLQRPDDVVRGEIAAMLESRKAIFPLLVEGARLPEAEELPQELAPLLRFQALAINNGDWGATSSLLIREIEAVIQQVERRHKANAGSGRTLGGREPPSGRKCG